MGKVARLTLTESLLIIALIGIGLGSIRSGSTFAFTFSVLLIVGWMSAATLWAIYTQGRRRGFWLGVTVFGWSFLILLNEALPGNSTLSSELNAALRDWVQAILEPPRTIPGELPQAMKVRYLEFAEYRIRAARISQIWLILGSTLIGGVIGAWFADQAADETNPTPLGRGGARDDAGNVQDASNVEEIPS